VSRVAVHLPPGHPHGEPDRTVVVAYRLGRIREGQDNFLIHTGQTIPLEQFTQGLVDQATVEYPDATVVVERLVMDDDGSDSAHWIPASEFDPAAHTPAGAGTGMAKTLHVSAGQEAG
jgi:hypothetical protein